MNLLEMLQQAFAARAQNQGGMPAGQSLWAAHGGRPPWGERMVSRPQGMPAPQTPQNPVPAAGLPTGQGTDLLSMLHKLFAARPGQQQPQVSSTQGPGTGQAPPAAPFLPAPPQVSGAMGGQVGGPNDPELLNKPPAPTTGGGSAGYGDAFSPAPSTPTNAGSAPLAAGKPSSAPQPPQGGAGLTTKPWGRHA